MRPRSDRHSISRWITDVLLGTLPLAILAQILQAKNEDTLVTEFCQGPPTVEVYPRLRGVRIGANQGIRVRDSPSGLIQDHRFVRRSHHDSRLTNADRIRTTGLFTYVREPEKSCFCWWS